MTIFRLGSGARRAQSTEPPGSLARLLDGATPVVAGANTVTMNPSDPSDTRLSERAAFVNTVNIIGQELTGVRGYISGQTLRPKSNGASIFLIEDQGSPSRNNYAYRTNEGVLHLDSLVHITKDGRNTPYLRQRAYTPDGDNGWRATINDVPYDQALRIGVNPDQIDGGCVKMFTSNGTIEGGAPWPIKLWHPSSDPALGGDVFSELTPQELREVSIVGDVLKAAMHCVGENVGKAALLELFRGAA